MDLCSGVMIIFFSSLHELNFFLSQPNILNLAKKEKK
jgi:hypothetical protein